MHLQKHKSRHLSAPRRVKMYSPRSAVQERRLWGGCAPDRGAFMSVLLLHNIDTKAARIEARVLLRQINPHAHAAFRQRVAGRVDQIIVPVVISERRDDPIPHGDGRLELGLGRGASIRVRPGSTKHLERDLLGTPVGCTRKLRPISVMRHIAGARRLLRGKSPRFFNRL
jgi:hypothetical protein